MMAYGIFVLICVTAALSTAASGGTCDKIVYKRWLTYGVFNTCYMGPIFIKSPKFLITSDRDESVEGFNAWYEKIHYLPRNLGEKFPSIVMLEAWGCAIKKVTKENFNGLHKLRYLQLNRNQIEKIDDDTFDGIPAVETINLSGNKIKELNGHAFASLRKLRHVGLEGNECINEDVNGVQIFEVPGIITSKCGFIEPNACGTVMKGAPTIVRGEKFDHGDLPWMVALYRRIKSKRQEYFCGGSVISEHHVLTGAKAKGNLTLKLTFDDFSAAHCLQDLQPENITAVFGAYDLNDPLEVGKSVQSPSRIFVHDHWNPQTTDYDADIAMLLMTEKIIFSTFVQPICIWGSQTAPSASIGILPGWGQSQNTSRDHEIIPTMLQLPIHTNEFCFLTFTHLAQLSSNRTFCAGSADGRGPCFGDSGGGFYVSVGIVYYLRGIVSSAWDVTIDGHCLLKKFTIYTDVVKFGEWIGDTMARK